MSKEKCIPVRDHLLNYRAQLANNIPHDKLLTGLDLATGFSRGLIEKIMVEINSIDSLETLVQQFSFQVQPLRSVGATLGAQF